MPTKCMDHGFVNFYPGEDYLYVEILGKKYLEYGGDANHAFRTVIMAVDLYCNTHNKKQITIINLKDVNFILFNPESTMRLISSLHSDHENTNQMAGIEIINSDPVFDVSFNLIKLSLPPSIRAKIVIKK